MSMDHDESTQLIDTPSSIGNILMFPSMVQPAPIKSKSERPMGPIEYAMRKKLDALKGSKYPDTFDWSTYDKIADRYGDKQPRGGVVFKTTFKLVNHHSSCSKCHYAFEIDSYGRGCVHNCEYCYAKEQLSAHGYWNRPMPFPVDLSEVRKIFYTVFETEKPNIWREVMEKRVPLRIGSMSDSFMWMDQKYGVTKELLRILNFYNYPYLIFTRSDLAAHEDYIGLIDPKLGSVQYSISGNNEKLIKAIEPGAPSVTRRFAALKTLAEAGIWTAARINPLFPLRPDGYFSNREEVVSRFEGSESIPEFPLYDNSLFDQLQESKVKTVIAGFVRLSPVAINAMSRATNINLKDFFLPDVMKGHNDKHYSDREIAYYYRWFRKECNVRGLRFTTCYIGNGAKDYFQYQGMWDNKIDCCDVVSNISTFTTTSQSVPWDERIRHAPNANKAMQSKDLEQEAEVKFGAKGTTEVEL
jgi:DNA repair photolyase